LGKSALKKEWRITIKRVTDAKKAFLEGKAVLCKNRETFKDIGSIIIKNRQIGVLIAVFFQSRTITKNFTEQNR